MLHHAVLHPGFLLPGEASAERDRLWSRKAVAPVARQ